MKENQDHLNLLRKISKKPSRSQRKLASELGFSLGKLNYCLNALKYQFVIYCDLLFQKLEIVFDRKNK